MVGIWARPGHLLHDHIHAHQCCQKFQLPCANRGIFTGQVREVAQKPGSGIDLQAQIGS